MNRAMQTVEEGRKGLKPKNGDVDVLVVPRPEGEVSLAGPERERLRAVVAVAVAVSSRGRDQTINRALSDGGVCSVQNAVGSVLYAV